MERRWLPRNFSETPSLKRSMVDLAEARYGQHLIDRAPFPLLTLMILPYQVPMPASITMAIFYVIHTFNLTVQSAQVYLGSGLPRRSPPQASRRYSALAGRLVIGIAAMASDLLASL
jgi:hypothetical protein